MKCKHCNGIGYDDTQRGTVMTEFPPCPWCGGSGYVKDKKQTNFDFMQSCTMEEMAEWLNKHSDFMYNCGKNHVPPKIMNKKEWKEWLKQPHAS